MQFADHTRIVMLALAMVIPVLVHADDDGKLYGGAVNGVWAVHPLNPSLQSNNSSVDSASIARDAERYTPNQLYGGLRLGDGFALEGAQTAFGAMPGDAARRATMATTGRPGQVPGTLSLAGVGSVPLDDTTAMVAKLGVHYWQADANLPSLDVSRLTSPGIVYGIGVEKQLAKDVRLQAQTERYRSNADAGNVPTVNVMMLGVNVGF
jgi:hypothetical protein